MLEPRCDLRPVCYMCAGIPSGKVHVEYDTVLAARKALQLSRSLLLDRPVYVSTSMHNDIAAHVGL